MKKIILGMQVLLLSFVGCTNQNTTQEEEWQVLTEKYNHIVFMANSITCNDSENWDFTAIGAKACGGPTGYIAYSLQIDVANFLNEVAAYTDAQYRYNIKWGIHSDCMVEPMPVSIECVNNTAHLIY